MSGSPRKFALCSLEPRIMLAADAASASPVVCAESADVHNGPQATNTDCQVGPSTLVFIDERVNDHPMLTSELAGSAEIHLVRTTDNGIDLISRSLTERSGIRSVHLITHGSSGMIQLGDAMIDASTLDRSSDQIRRWKQSLSPNADLILYGCNVAAGNSGEVFLETLAMLTGADVAASDDTTGVAEQGGDWELEFVHGNVDQQSFVSRTLQRSYTGLLPITIYAAGQTGQEAMTLKIDGEVVATWDGVGGDVDNREFETFEFATDELVDANRIEVGFINDLYLPGEIDRNLMVDRIVVNGEELQAEASTVYSNATWDPDLGFEPRFAYYEFLHTNGEFSFGQVPEASIEYRSIDGYGNNLSDPEAGSTNELLERVAAPDYADGVSEVGGVDRPSPRLISNEVAAQTAPTGNARGLSTAVWVWGQFLDHDLSLSEPPPEAEEGSHGHSEREELLIPVPQGDPSFDPFGTGRQVIETARTEAAEYTGTGTDNPRQQTNLLSAYLDAGQVYGSDQETADSLRTFEGGRMRTSEGDLLPVDEEGDFIAGDVRANENVNLSAMHTLFLREHNRLTEELSQQNSDWDDETLYQESRRLVTGQIQAITFQEFLPALLGEYSVSEYSGYDDSVNVGVANEFAHAGFRLGHTMVNDTIQLTGEDGVLVQEPLRLADAFDSPQLLKDNGIDTLLKGMLSVQAEEIDNQIVDSLRNFLFGPPGAGGLDLASLNIVRGRDHGLADYNSVRESYGLQRVNDFSDITRDEVVSRKLKELYGNVDNIDVWVGALSEDHVPGSSLGELMHTIVSDQFWRVREGDRFWYQRDLSGDALDFVHNTTLSDVIRRNTAVDNIQEDAMFMRASVAGRVTSHDDGSAQQGIHVSLYDETEQQIASVLSDENGEYYFGNIYQTGIYHIVVESLNDDVDDRQRQTVQIDRGEIYLCDINFCLA